MQHVCENILIHDVEIENCCHLLKIADRHLAHNLKKHCMSYLLKHFEAVAKTSSFEELSSVPSLLLEVTRAAAANAGGGGRSMNMGGESGNS